MTKADPMFWSSKVANCIGSTTELACLPPTFYAYALSIARAHLQVVIGKHSADSSPLKFRQLSQQYGTKKVHVHHLFQFHFLQIFLKYQKFSNSMKVNLCVLPSKGNVVLRGSGWQEAERMEKVLCYPRLISVICLPGEISSKDTLADKERVAWLQGCHCNSIEVNWQHKIEKWPW